MAGLTLLEVPAGSEVTRLLPALAAALAGQGPALLPYAEGSPPPVSDPPDDLPRDVALVVGTSGSMGPPKLALLTAAALHASAAATHERLSGPGRWVLALPTSHIAGIQVLVRSLVAGTTPTRVDARNGFTPAAFRAATHCLDGSDVPAYIALVPTQLVRLLADPASTAALRRYHAVLLGAAAAPSGLLDAAHRSGVRVVTTYGMSETAGGCVYDGVPLGCSRAGVDDDGRVWLGGATLASGYLGRPDLTSAAFTAPPALSEAAPGPGGPSYDVRPGTGTGRWFRTDDVGHLDEHGRLVVDGRADDALVTGGLKVLPAEVERVLLDAFEEVDEAAVVGVDNPEWGQRVVAAVVTVGGIPAPSVEEVRARLRDRLPAHALPREVVQLRGIPLLGPGKPDRAAVRRSVGEWLQTTDRRR